MLKGHRLPGTLGFRAEGDNQATLLLGGEKQQQQRLGSSRLRRHSHLKKTTPPPLSLELTHPLAQRRWRSRLLRQQLPIHLSLLKRFEAQRQNRQREFSQQQAYQRWVKDIFGQEGRQLLAVAAGRHRRHRHFAAQPLPNHQLHYPAYRSTPLWIYSAGFRHHLPPLAVENHHH
jgi:hypothetical protein